MPILNLFMRWLHIVSAIMAVGATAFLRFALLPAASQLNEEIRTALTRQLAAPLQTLIHTAIGGLLLSGVYNTTVQWKTSVYPYGWVYAAKITLAAFIFLIAMLLTSSKPKWAAFQSHRRKWLAVNIILAAILIALSAGLRTLHQ